MATGTYYPFADGGDASIYASSTADWATPRNATTGTLRTGNYIQATLSGPTRFIERTFLTLDTSAIPDTANISSAVLYVYITSVSNANSPSYRLYNSTHTDTIIAGDYDLMGTTEQSGTYLTTPTASAYASFTLNAAGLASINKTGYTKFAIREASYDVANTQPGGSNVLQIADSNTANDPYLEVTYTVGTDYPITISAGSYTYTGVATGLSSARYMLASLGTYTLTGIDTAFKLGKGIVASLGTYTYTGTATGLSAARTMLASLGTYTLTGIDITLKKGFGLMAEVGSYVYTGITVGLISSAKWSTITKSVATWTNNVKNSSVWTEISKNVSTWSNRNKNQ